MFRPSRTNLIMLLAAALATAACGIGNTVSGNGTTLNLLFIRGLEAKIPGFRCAPLSRSRTE